jgi:hypothetical protein
MFLAYELSMAVGELALLPAVRQAPAGAVIIDDGVTCREQFARGPRRRAVHLAEAIRRAQCPHQVIDSRREADLADLPASAPSVSPRVLAAACLIGIGATLGAVAVRRRRRS